MTRNHENYAPTYNFDTFSQRELFGRMSEESKQQILDQINRAQVVVDLGSGLGSSTKSILSLVSQPQKIFTVDGYVSHTHVDTEKYGGEHSHFHGEIHDFLSDAKIQADLVVLRGVPRHRLRQNNGYSNLAKIVRVHGLVIEFGDTELDKETMIQFGFKPLQIHENTDSKGRFFSRNAI